MITPEQIRLTIGLIIHLQKSAFQESQSLIQRNGPNSCYILARIFWEINTFLLFLNVTPPKTNGWNLKTIPLEKETNLQHPSFMASILVFAADRRSGRCWESAANPGAWGKRRFFFGGVQD